MVVGNSLLVTTYFYCRTLFKVEAIQFDFVEQPPPRNWLLKFSSRLPGAFICEERFANPAG